MFSLICSLSYQLASSVRNPSVSTPHGACWDVSDCAESAKRVESDFTTTEAAPPRALSLTQAAQHLASYLFRSLETNARTLSAWASSREEVDTTSCVHDYRSCLEEPCTHGVLLICERRLSLHEINGGCYTVAQRYDV